MDIAAVICVRDDEPYLASCLSHLIDDGVQYAVIDNGLTGASRDLLAEPRFRRNLVGLTELPFTGRFELDRQIEKKEEVIAGLGADWALHLDVDEVMQSPLEGESLSAAIARLDREGWTAINFDEFVFLPLDEPYRPGAVPQPLRRYYYFRPMAGPRLMRARKQGAGLSMSPPGGGPSAGGHALFGERLDLAPESFVLRHYIVRDQAHAEVKYAARRFSLAELERGWHRNRVGVPVEAYAFPSPDLLRQLPHPGSRAFDRSDPKAAHYWQWPRP